MTLMANLATLRDLGKAYWVHKYDSSWIAKICVDTYLEVVLKKKHTQCKRDSGTSTGQVKELKPGGVREASPAFPTGAGPAALG